MKDIQYKVINGTSYHAETPQAICNVLERARASNMRILLDYGDAQTGQSWGEEFDIRGSVGRSTGPVKIPLLLATSRSSGGGGILDHCLVRISASKGGRVLYQHPSYKPPVDQVA